MYDAIMTWEFPWLPEDSSPILPTCHSTSGTASCSCLESVSPSLYGGLERKLTNVTSLAAVGALPRRGCLPYRRYSNHGRAGAHPVRRQHIDGWPLAGLALAGFPTLPISLKTRKLGLKPAKTDTRMSNSTLGGAGSFFTSSSRGCPLRRCP